MKLRKIGMVATIIAVVTSLSVPVLATTGKLVYSHGIIAAEQATIGTISASTFQEAMKITMTVKSETLGTVKYYETPTVKGAKYLSYKKFVEGQKGSSFCKFFVDGYLEHESTAWYKFDFTK